MFDKKHYMITVDYYSYYFEIDRLYCTTTSAIVKNLKNHFARHGIPDKVMTDNGPNFVSDKFVKFAESWNFLHTSSSSYYSRSNGKAETAVKIAKCLGKYSNRGCKCITLTTTFFATYKNKTSNNRKVVCSKCFKTRV